MKFPSVLSVLALCAGLNLFAQTPPPPEYVEFQKAMAITDISARIKELQRIKAAYPNSEVAFLFNSGLLGAMTNAANSLDKVIAAQKEIIAATKSIDRINLITGAVQLIIRHEKIGSFPKDGVLKAIQNYKAEAIEFIAKTDVIGEVPEEARASVTAQVKNAFEIPLAKVQLMNGNGKTALAILEEYAKTQPGNEYYYNVLGDVYLDQKKDKEALEAFTKAAVGGDKDTVAKAKKLYEKLNGDSAKFDADLERKQSELPFHPPAFAAPADWKGKAVLAELFTGSECPPCLAADFAFDGFIESYPSKHLVILEYHLPIPRPDPMMNPATKMRGDYYTVTSTPTVIVDGVNKIPAGGPRTAAEESFNSIKAEIDPLMGAETEVTIKATAKLEGDKVVVNCEFSKVLENADYQIALVQSEEKHKGGNGIIFHKMVVRDIETVKPSDKASVTFNIPESEKATDAHLSELETRLQARDFKWAVRMNKIDRDKLKAVVFVQDKETKKVHNAFLADATK